MLDAKGLADASDLRAAVGRDLHIATAAAAVAPTLTLDAVLDLLLSDTPEARAAAAACAIAGYADHIGFQIHEPLDIWLDGAAGWAERLGVELVGRKRFTASEAFQGRVGAFVEMAQVWFMKDGRQVELELFDIHHRVPLGQAAADIDAAAAGHRLTEGTFDELRALLVSDDIWHFGVRVGSVDEVESLHVRFQDLCRADRRFRLRTEETVANRWHGSVHTKLANLDTGVEVEFLTYEVDWGD